MAVNSRVDNQGFLLNDDYLLTRIVELDFFSKRMYVYLRAGSDLDLYGIDLSKMGSGVSSSSNGTNKGDITGKGSKGG